MKHIQKSAIALMLTVGVGFVSCTKLEEKLNSSLTADQAQSILLKSTDVSVLLQACYDGLQGFQSQDVATSLQENSSDESLVPTRGGDWDDNGVWRVIHAHTWNADHAQVGGVFNNLLGVVFNTTNVLNFSPSASQAAEARFIRAFAMYTVLDLYGQVPFREAGENLLNAPKVLKGAEAATFIISELNAIKASLPNGPSAGGPAFKANKDAADVLLMKMYLNKGAYGNRAAPTFDAADMNAAITIARSLSTKYTISANVWDNYAPSNDVIGKENIFTNQNIGGSRGGNLRAAWYKTNHYNMNKSGWNGFTTLAAVYDKFEATDTRLGVNYPDPAGVLPNPKGVNTTGFLIGQQYDLKTGAALQDRKGAPLSFTRTVALQESGNNLEVTGIRYWRYVVDNKDGNDGQPDNDYVFFRYSDVVLMEAEAILRGGTAQGGVTALSLVNSLRSKRGATPATSVILKNADQNSADAGGAISLLNERQREFHWDGWRRQDQIRFGTFLSPNALKPVTDAKYLLFPIPNGALAVNPNLTQNPGY